MNTTAISTTPAVRPRRRTDHHRLLLGTGLAFASLILVPALAAHMGLGTSLTGALRIALMRASSRAVGGSSAGSEGATTCFSCH